jgi:type VI secretion system secreted protein Hcp
MADHYAFLELEGVEGEAQDAKFKDQIEVLSWDFGSHNQSSAAHLQGPAIGRGQLQDVNISKFVDKSSPELTKRCLTGQPISKGKLSVVKLAGTEKIPYLVYEFEKIFITSCHQSGSGGSELPHEQISFTFVKVKKTYTIQDNDGTASGTKDFGWNRQENTEA